jgi:hypothetical protein
MQEEKWSRRREGGGAMTPVAGGWRSARRRSHGRRGDAPMTTVSRRLWSPRPGGSSAAAHPRPVRHGGSWLAAELSGGWSHNQVGARA